MKIIIIVIILMILVFSMNSVYAETFQSYNEDNYLFLEISNDKAFALMKINGKITSIQEEDIKYYNNENFRINFENRIILLGAPVADSINITIHDKLKNLEITLMTQKVDNTSYEKPIKQSLTVLEKFERASEITGMELVVPLKKEKKKDIPDEKEIKILTQIPVRFPYYQEFFFDVRVVDSALNISKDFWNDVGFINDVEIISTIKDPHGTILNQFTGNTTGKGHFAPVNGTLFSFNSVLLGAYTLEVNATKYFDESARFATDSIIREFFVFSPNDHTKSVSPIECELSDNGLCVDECPDGKFRMIYSKQSDICKSRERQS